MPGLALPNELLVEIAFYLTQYSATDHVLSVSSLSALSLVSRRIRHAVLPQLFRAIPLVKQTQLHSLPNLPPHLLGHCRILNLIVHPDCLVSNQSQVESTYHDACHSLANILSKTPRLTNLRLATSHSSPWLAFPLMPAHGLSIQESLQHAFHSSSLPQFVLPNLRTLSLHGIEGCTPLLQLAPNLQSLRLLTSAGFALDVNSELVEALDFVPNLKSLAYSPDTLRLQSPAVSVVGARVLDDNENNENIGPSLPPSRGTADLLIAISRKLPLLESLDLQTRWFGDSTYFCSSSEPISSEELTYAVSNLTNLRHLRLPSNLASAPDFALVRAPLCSISHHASYTIMMIPPSKSLIAARRMALSRDACSERRVADQLFHSYGPGPRPSARDMTRSESPERDQKKLGLGRLSSISFVRQIHPEDRLEYAVTYSRAPRCDRHHAGSNTMRVTVARPSGEEVDVPLAMMGLGEPLLPLLTSPLSTSSLTGTSSRRATKGGENPRGDTSDDEEMISLWEPMSISCSSAPWSPSFFQSLDRMASAAVDAFVYADLLEI